MTTEQITRRTYSATSHITALMVRSWQLLCSTT